MKSATCSCRAVSRVTFQPSINSANCSRSHWYDSHVSGRRPFSTRRNVMYSRNNGAFATGPEPETIPQFLPPTRPNASPRYPPRHVPRLPLALQQNPLPNSAAVASMASFAPFALRPLPLPLPLPLSLPLPLPLLPLSLPLPLPFLLSSPQGTCFRLCLCRCFLLPNPYSLFPIPYSLPFSR